MSLSILLKMQRPEECSRTLATELNSLRPKSYVFSWKSSCFTFSCLSSCYVLRLSPVDPRMALNFSCSWGIELFIFLFRHSKSWNYEHMPPYLFSSVWGMEPMVSLMLDKHSTKWTVFSLLNVISGNSH